MQQKKDEDLRAVFEEIKKERADIMTRLQQWLLDVKESLPSEEYEKFKEEAHGLGIGTDT